MNNKVDLQDWSDRFSELYEAEGTSPQELPQEFRPQFAEFCKIYSMLQAAEFPEPEIPRDFRSGILARISEESRKQAKLQKRSFWELLPKFSARLALAGAAAVLAVFLLLNPATRQSISRAFVGEGRIDRAQPDAPSWAQQPMGPLTVNIRYAAGQASASVELSANLDVAVQYGLGKGGVSQMGRVGARQPLTIGLPGNQVASLLVNWSAEAFSGSFRLIVPFGPYRPEAKLALRSEMMDDFLARAAQESGCLILAPADLPEKTGQFSEELPVFVALKRGCGKNIEIFDLETGTKLVVLATN